VPSKADNQSRHAVEAFASLNLNGNGSTSEHSDEEVRETVDGEVRMNAGRVNGNANGHTNGGANGHTNGHVNGNSNGNGNGCCGRS